MGIVHYSSAEWRFTVCWGDESSHDCRALVPGPESVLLRMRVRVQPIRGLGFSGIGAATYKDRKCHPMVWNLVAC